MSRQCHVNPVNVPSMSEQSITTAASFEIQHPPSTMNAEEDSIMEGLDGTEPGSIKESTESHDETMLLNPAHLAPTSLKDAAPSLSDPALSPSPPPVGSRTLPGVPSDEIVDEDTDTPMSDSSELDEDVEEVVPKAPQMIEVALTKPADPALPYASRRTGLVYDVRMRFHTELNTDEEDIHPEDPRRIYAIHQALLSAGLVLDQAEPMEDYVKHPFKLWRLPIRLAEQSEIALVHGPELYDWVNSLKGTSTATQDLPFFGTNNSLDWENTHLIERARELDSVYLHQTTMYCASLSCGGAIEACKAVVAGLVKNAIAVIRPPGHHAEHDKPGGFCFFNNVCVAAKVCQNTFGNACRKVMILDWDVHHGNGIQQAFEDDPNVLYVSLHVHKNGQFYPPGNYGDHLHCGLGEGLGKNINIPWPTHGMVDGDYLYAFQQVVMPVAQEFEPDLVIISAGFDAAEGDLLGACHISPAGYAHMTHMLMSLAHGKVAVCLEGGYNLNSIARSATAVTKTLMGEPPDRVEKALPSKVGIDTVQLVKRTHSEYWKCLYPKDLYRLRLSMGGERLHDVLRAKQAYEWADKFGMVPLYVNRDRISKSFENQVLATPSYTESHPLLVIFHDPPETIGQSDPVNGKLAPHNIVVVSPLGGYDFPPLTGTQTDVAKSYVEWAIQNDFSVIDVNVPSHITPEVDTGSYVHPDDEDLRQATTRELATYLWDNYIEISDATHIYFMGVGSAYSAITWLLSNEERTTERIDGVIAFLSNSSILPVTRPADDGAIATWYYQHSNIFVGSYHYFWAPERPKKLRKRYGKLQQSPHNDLIDMLRHHQTEVTDALQRVMTEWREEMAREEEEKLRRESMNQFVNIKPAPMMLDGGPMSPVRGTQMSPIPMKSPPSKVPPMGTFTVTSSPSRPRSAGSPGRPGSRGSPSRR